MFRKSGGMLYKTLIMILFMLCAYLLTAQQDTGSDRIYDDYQKFKQTYDNEVAIEAVRPVKTILHPASVPDILKNIPRSNLQSVYSVGISDPGMEENKAIELATIRAKIIAALMVLPEIGILTDNYANEKQKSKSSEFVTRYSNFFQLSSSLAFDSTGFTVENIDFTSFGEAVVLIRYKIPTNQTSRTIFAKASAYQNERQKQVSFDTEGKFEIRGSEKINDSIIFSTSYEVTSLNNISNIQTIIDNKVNILDYLNYRYSSDTTNYLPDSLAPGGTKLTYGLWKAFADQFLVNIFQNSQKADFDIKQVDDSYNAGKQTLSRELIKSQATFQLSEILIFNNHLSLKIDPIN